MTPATIDIVHPAIVDSILGDMDADRQDPNAYLNSAHPERQAEGRNVAARFLEAVDATLRMPANAVADVGRRLINPSLSPDIGDEFLMHAYLVVGKPVRETEWQDRCLTAIGTMWNQHSPTEELSRTTRICSRLSGLDESSRTVTATGLWSHLDSLQRRLGEDSDNVLEPMRLEVATALATAGAGQLGDELVGRLVEYAVTHRDSGAWLAALVPHMGRCAPAAALRMFSSLKTAIAESVFEPDVADELLVAAGTALTLREPTLYAMSVELAGRMSIRQAAPIDPVQIANLASLLEPEQARSRPDGLLGRVPEMHESIQVDVTNRLLTVLGPVG